MKQFFPFTISPNPKFGGIVPEYYSLFVNHKPDGLTWYACDVVVNSPTQLEFVMYGMADYFYGGVGDEVARFCLAVDRDVNSAALIRRSVELAEWYEDQRLVEERRKRVQANADALLAEALRNTTKTP